MRAVSGSSDSKAPTLRYFRSDMLATDFGVNAIFQSRDHESVASPLVKGKRMKVRGSLFNVSIIPELTLTFPLSLKRAR